MVQHSFSIAQPKTFAASAKTLTSELGQPQELNPESCCRQNYYQGGMSEGSTAACRIIKKNASDGFKNGGVMMMVVVEVVVVVVVVARGNKTRQDSRPFF